VKKKEIEWWEIKAVVAVCLCIVSCFMFAVVADILIFYC